MKRKGKKIVDSGGLRRAEFSLASQLTPCVARPALTSYNIKQLA